MKPSPAPAAAEALTSPAGWAPSGLTPDYRPWPALIALVAGIFMILVDTTIVAVATDAIWVELHADINSVVWVTSAYLLAYVVPLLLCGRLGDVFGPRPVYVVGLLTFTAASAWCGLSGTVQMLIAARAVQGVGAALMAPQTMSVITRTFPAQSRGKAMALWGAVGGVAIIVGPIAGGVLVEHLGWQSVFFVNVPVGLVALAAALRWVPRLPRISQRIDYLGIGLSGVAMFLLVFGLQQGQHYDWGHLLDVGPVPVSVRDLLVAGVVVLAAFGWWQLRVAHPLMPPVLFRDRNFALSCVAVAAMGFSLTGMALPLMLFAQKSLGLSPIRAALLLVPLAVLAAALAVPAGHLADTRHPSLVTGFGFALNAAAAFWLAADAYRMSSVPALLWPIALVGAGNAFIWGPLTATANRNVPVELAGSGSGVYNATRQVGGVLGSAAVGAFMQQQLLQRLPGLAVTGGANVLGSLPGPARRPFAEAMGASLYVPAGALVVGLVVVQLLVRSDHDRRQAKRLGSPAPTRTTSG